MITACTNFGIRFSRFVLSVWDQMINEPTAGESICRCFANMKAGLKSGLQDFSRGQIVILGAGLVGTASVAVIVTCILYSKGSKEPPDDQKRLPV